MYKVNKKWKEKGTETLKQKINEIQTKEVKEEKKEKKYTRHTPVLTFFPVPFFGPFHFFPMGEKKKKKNKNVILESLGIFEVLRIWNVRISV